MEIQKGSIISCQMLEPQLVEWVKQKPVTVELSLLELGINLYVKEIGIFSNREKFHFQVSFDFPSKLSEMGKREVENWIIDAFIRSGCLQHLNLKNEILPKIQIYDDIILAVDTNIILNCVFTSTFLGGGHLCSNKVKQPNWVLVVIPKLVMAEIEDWANCKIKREIKELRSVLTDDAWKTMKDKSHPWSGRASYRGRVGQRALQEVLELDTNVEYRGLSIMTVGKLPELYGTSSYKKEVRVDSDIRVQIKDFIKSIDFHKGMFFLTQDRVSTMMACAEGIQGLYLQKPTWEQINKNTLIANDLWRVIYELTVSFGQVRILQESNPLLEVSIYWPAKHVSEWERSCIKVV